MSSSCRPPAWASPRLRRSAVTLIEMMTVLMIVGVIAVSSAGVLGTAGPEARLRNETHELLSAARFAQQLALGHASLGSGIQCRVNFYNCHEFGLELVNPVEEPPPLDPGVTVAVRTDSSLGLTRRIGSDAIPDNKVGDPPNPLVDRFYFTNAAGDVHLPTGGVGDRIVYQGRAGPTLLPWTGPPSAPTIFDRIVITGSDVLPPAPGTKRFVIRLDHWSGHEGADAVPWMEVSVDEALNVP